MTAIGPVCPAKTTLRLLKINSWKDRLLYNVCGCSLTQARAAQVSISDFLTLFSSRTQGFFWTSVPAPLLTAAALFSLSLSTLLACVWPSSHAERNLPVRGLSRSGYKVWPLWVCIYCLVW